MTQQPQPQPPASSHDMTWQEAVEAVLAEEYEKWVKREITQLVEVDDEPDPTGAIPLYKPSVSVFDMPGEGPNEPNAPLL